MSCLPNVLQSGGKGRLEGSSVLAPLRVRRTGMSFSFWRSTAARPYSAVRLPGKADCDILQTLTGE